MEEHTTLDTNRIIQDLGFPNINGEVYLDHAGATLHNQAHITAFTTALNKQLLANPHSQSDSSQFTTRLVETTRTNIIEFFGGTPATHTAVFTANATAAIKLVAENFPWQLCDQSKEIPGLIYLDSNHTSVIGVREYAKQHNICFECWTEVDVENYLNSPNTQTQTPPPACLFIFPAECNFSGTLYDLDWCKRFHQRIDRKWFVFSDTAKFAATHPLQLSFIDCDFACVSFYKIFGFPTGIGCLLAKNESLQCLKKVYFGGGAIAAAAATSDFVRLRSNLSAKLEDGTLPFSLILAVQTAIDTFATHKITMSQIERHTQALAQSLREKLSQLRHFNGKPVCEIYGFSSTPNTKSFPNNGGSIVGLNILRSQGEYVGYAEVEKLAATHRLHIRTGCFCNPGACQRYLHLTDKDIQANIESGKVCWDENDLVNGKPTGALRISVGYMTTTEDIQAFVEFCTTFFVESKEGMFAPSVPKAVETTNLELREIVVYPVKSCAGMSVMQWPISPIGLLFDREWMLVSPAGASLSQKQIPQMAQVVPHIDLAARTMTMTSPNNKIPLIIQLDAQQKAVDSNQPLSVCGDACGGVVCDDEMVNDWFSAALGQPCKLVRIHPAVPHTRTHITSTTDSNTTKSIGFSNEGQYLVLSSFSVQHLAKKLIETSQTASKAQDISHLFDTSQLTKQFRANLVVGATDGSEMEPHQEDCWREMRIGNTVFESFQPCNRCKMICVDPINATFTREPLQTLATYRRNQGKITFGMLAAHDEQTTLALVGPQKQFLRVGLPVVITKQATNETN